MTTELSRGRIASIAVACLLALVLVSGLILCRVHAYRGAQQRKHRELERRCRSIVRKERDAEFGSMSSSDGSACSGCSDSECWGRTIQRERMFGATLAPPPVAYDPDLERVMRWNDKQVVGR